MNYFQLYGIFYILDENFGQEQSDISEVSCHYFSLPQVRSLYKFQVDRNCNDHMEFLRPPLLILLCLFTVETAVYRQWVWRKPVFWNGSVRSRTGSATSRIGNFVLTAGYTLYYVTDLKPPTSSDWLEGQNMYYRLDLSPHMNHSC